MPPRRNARLSPSPTIDPKQAKAAYEELTGTLDRLRSDELISVRVDAQLAAAHAFGVCERDRAEERAARFEKLVAAELLAPLPLDRLAQAALATWYARQQQVRYAARGAGTVAAPVAAEAEAIKKRMLKVVAHAFGDHAQYSVEINAIRAGNGYLDLANDLQQLAELYEIDEIEAVVRHDPVHYRDTDVADARARAADIFKALGYESSPDAAQWTLRVQRAYTHLDDLYGEHCAAGAFLFRRLEDVSVTYPTSLVSVVRAPRGRSEAVVETDPVGPSPGDPIVES